ARMGVVVHGKAVEWLQSKLLTAHTRLITLGSKVRVPCFSEPTVWGTMPVLGRVPGKETIGVLDFSLSDEQRDLTEAAVAFARELNQDLVKREDAGEFPR